MKHRSIVIVIVFAVLLALVPVLSIALPDKATSTVERRSLALWKSLNAYRKDNPRSKVSDYFTSIEDYLLDQFPLRNEMRSISALAHRYVFSQFDHDRYFKVKGHLGKLDFTFREKVVANAVALFNKVYEEHFRGGEGRHLFALIPDKNHYMANGTIYPSVDIKLYMEAIDQTMSLKIEKLSLEDLLSLDMYYRTDPHWNQIYLRPIADTLLEKLQNPIRVNKLSFDVGSVGTFLGTYAGQAAFPAKADDLEYLDHSSIGQARVYDPFEKKETSVYRFDLRDSMDPYDFFLGGAQPLFVVKNGAAESNRRLVVFRDSFGSSLVPLLIPAYSEILVVDLRYVRPDVISDELDMFHDADVLFLYSTTVLNAPGAFPVS
ncbi:MAG: DHHW family protein [Saccharofermentanales bacterium]|jgi:hypothetical protein